MASPFAHTNGFGGSSGATLATVAPVYTSGNTWFVQSTTGTDAVSPRGKERLRPLATLAQAHTNAANGDVIVMLSGHTETLTGTVTLSKTGVTYLGEGSGSNRPKFKRNVDADGIVFSGAGCWVENLYFQTDGAAALTTGDRVNITAASVTIYNCYFECSSTDVTTSAVLDVGAVNNIYIGGGTQFVCTTTGAAVPALVCGATSDLTLNDVSFDGGTAGWNTEFAVSLGAATRLRATNVDLLNGSDVTVATGSSYVFHVRNETGSSRLILTA